MASLPPTPKSEQKQSQRLPPPALFQGPPSPSASQVSLPSLLPTSTNASKITTPKRSPSQRTPFLRNRSARIPTPTNNTSLPTSSSTSPLGRQTQTQAQAQQQLQSEGDRTDALWAEMQNTLAEVELSAVSGTHVFGEEHAKALEELRTAQIELAQAWARSEADELVEDPAGESLGVEKGAGVGNSRATEGGRSGGGGAGKEDGKGRRGTKLEEETESDILLARKRREANDQYFQRVNGGVLDVVAKLEEVAVAMRAIERESRDIWSESDSVDTS
ncbi:MAG: hypothetical protein M1830_005877, partial [Pleopsidium flavum]